MKYCRAIFVLLLIQTSFMHTSCTNQDKVASSKNSIAKDSSTKPLREPTLEQLAGKHPPQKRGPADIFTDTTGKYRDSIIIK